MADQYLNKEGTVKLVGNISEVLAEKDVAIQAAQSRADEAYNHLPDEVSAQAAGLIPQLPDDEAKYFNGKGSWVDVNRGARWWFGTDLTYDEESVQGSTDVAASVPDIYYNTDEGWVFQFDGEAWQYVATITGGAAQVPEISVVTSFESTPANETAYAENEVVKLLVKIMDISSVAAYGVTVKTDLGTIQEGEGYDLAQNVATITSINPGASAEVRIQYTITQADYSTEKKFHITAGSETVPQKEVDSEVIPITETNKSLSASATVASSDGDKYYPNSTATYSVVVTNDGNVDLAGIEITQSLEGATFITGDNYTFETAKATIASLKPKADVTVKSTYTVAQGDVGKPVNNTFTVKCGEVQKEAAATAFTAETKPIEPPADSAALDKMSWGDIAALSAAAAANPDQYKSLTAAGAKFEKTIHLTGISGVDEVKCLIIGVGQDVDESGNKCGLTFQLRDGLSYNQPTAMRMNPTADTTGGWETCEMRTTNLPKIEAALPSDLRAVLKTVKKKTNMTTSGSTLKETTDKLNLLSYTEVFGDDQAPNSSNSPQCKGEGEWYQWYESHNTNDDRVIKQETGSANNWWLRSAYNATSFGLVGSYGAWSGNGANNSYLPCACFSV